MIVIGVVLVFAAFAAIALAMRRDLDTVIERVLEAERAREAERAEEAEAEPWDDEWDWRERAPVIRLDERRR